MMLRVLAVVFMLASLAACAVAPSQYYSLGANSPEAAEAGQKTAPGYALRLRVLEVPAELDRPQIVLRAASAVPQPAEVQVLNNHLWSAPLLDQIQAQLAAHAAWQLGAPDVNGLPIDPATAKQRSLSVRITRFDLFWGESALLQAAWSDRLPGAAPAHCQALLSTKAAPEMNSMVAAQRANLIALARLMAEPANARVYLSENADSRGLQNTPEVSEFGCT